MGIEVKKLYLAKLNYNQPISGSSEKDCKEEEQNSLLSRLETNFGYSILREYPKEVFISQLKEGKAFKPLGFNKYITLENNDKYMVIAQVGNIYILKDVFTDKDLFLCVEANIPLQETHKYAFKFIRFLKEKFPKLEFEGNENLTFLQLYAEWYKDKLLVGLLKKIVDTNKDQRKPKLLVEYEASYLFKGIDLSRLTTLLLLIEEIGIENNIVVDIVITSDKNLNYLRKKFQHLPQITAFEIPENAVRRNYRKARRNLKKEIPISKIILKNDLNTTRKNIAKLLKTLVDESKKEKIGG